MELIEEFIHRVKTTGPLKTTKGSPDGERNYWIVSDAEIEGRRIKARIAARRAVTGCAYPTMASGGQTFECLLRPTTARPCSCIIPASCSKNQFIQASSRSKSTDRMERPIYAADHTFRLRCRALPLAQYVAVCRQGPLTWDG